MTRKPAGPHGSTTRSGGRKGTVPAQPPIHQDKVDSEVAPTKGTANATEKVSEQASGKGASVQVPGEKHESPKKGPEQDAEKGHDSETAAGKAGDDKVTGKRLAEEAPTTDEQPVGLKRQKMACGRNGVVVGPRIPFQYFVTKVSCRVLASMWNPAVRLFEDRNVLLAGFASDCDCSYGV